MFHGLFFLFHKKSSYLCKPLQQREHGKEQRTVTGVHTRRAHHDWGREAQAHRQPQRAQHTGSDFGHRHVLHRRGHGGTPRRTRHGCHRTGRDDHLAHGRTGVGGQHGILRAGGPLHRRQRLRCRAPRATAGSRLLPAVEPHAHDGSRSRPHPPALLARRLGRHCPRRLALLHAHRHLRHLLPDGGPGRLHAEMLGQHEDTVDAQHHDVRARRRL